MRRAAGDGEQGEDRERDDLLASQSRTLRNSLISLAVFFAIVVLLLLAVPGLQTAADRISDANPRWVLGGIGLELLSCASYMVLFDLVFARIGRSLVTRLSLSELAVNSVVSVSGLAGLALGAWVLRSRGVSVHRIAKRSVLIFVVTSAASAAGVVVIGVPMWLGLLPGSTDPLLTLLPAVVAVGAIAATVIAARWAGRRADRLSERDSRSAIALIAISGGVADCLSEIRAHDRRLLGAVGYWLFDAATLYAALAAFGHAPSFWAVAMAYLVGMIANSLPIPGGFGAVEGGLVGMLDLFDVAPGSTVIAAVVVYRAISLWVPALTGSLAFLSLRREIAKPAVRVVGGEAG
ncbi:MAG TPA: YbhN family protein [Solirubrobacteraceae bacterium]|nr:YbhN family protein [Solirubrobacteraceae bacterium]